MYFQALSVSFKNEQIEVIFLVQTSVYLCRCKDFNCEFQIWMEILCPDVEHYSYYSFYHLLETIDMSIVFILQLPVKVSHVSTMANVFHCQRVTSCADALWDTKETTVRPVRNIRP